MKYVALLRGINVGGNTMIKMTELKAAFEKAGFTDVVTYINSGNVVFSSENTNIPQIAKTLEEKLTKEFHYNALLVIRSQDELQKVISQAPEQWKNGADVRCYVAFVREPVTVTEVMKEVEVREGIDEAQGGKFVMYMTTKTEGLTKSKFSKLAGKKIYKDITIRNFTTVMKLLTLMEKK